MRGRKRLTRRGWRWRRNPLRRRTDVVESWLALVTAALFCALPLLGWWAERSVDRTLRHEVATEHAQRTLVSATLAHPKDSGSATRPAEVLRWTAPDHSVHTATVSSDLEVWQRGRISLWTDHKGTLVPPPLDTVTATTHAVLAGVAVGSAAAGLLVISRQLLMWRLMLRRMDSWEREWARVDQDWGRAGAGG
ncbi:hypothetical protein SAMN05216223_12178 [Actinacidiphila yanglinensis]|uniref:Uncharacterized protein n=1 Tax=Actinacidiphila yanglinensis TaxID=310779 RepID=A0A1H6DZ43_9ACTN|nr:hypothetical protein [Actinacidiphila yanglinensis]SEG90093.1 hypothetical protein SAMN05216223_12178 [Actinacidiphila yanglinensis]